MPSKLARSLSLSLRGRQVNVKTPLLVPSFSSKALVDVDAVFEALQPSITESFLVSAYDIHFGKIEIPDFPFAEVVFLDSGGYEISKDHDLMDPLYASPEPKEWTVEKYRSVLERVDPIMPTFVTAFDHPEVRRPISEQIDVAEEVFKRFPDLGRELLFKPEIVDQEFVPIPRLIAQVSRFSEFDMVGITETELGDSMLDRMVNIARIRIAMDDEDIIKPLHIFGSLTLSAHPSISLLAQTSLMDSVGFDSHIWMTWPSITRTTPHSALEYLMVIDSAWPESMMQICIICRKLRAGCCDIC